MSTIVTRSGKGSPLTHNEVDANFNNLNTDKIQSGNTVAALTVTSATVVDLAVTGITSFDGAQGTAGQVLTSAGTGNTPTWVTPSTSSGTVTSVAATVPSLLSVSGSPITTSGTLAFTYSGTALPVANGGTGQTTASAAFNALSPITTTGDLIIGNGTNSTTRLAIGANTYVLTSNGTTATWAAAGGGSSFPAGTKMLFQQTSAPTGWTKVTTTDNAALRLVSGTVSSGGTVDFTTAFAANSVGATTLSTAQLASHNHYVGLDLGSATGQFGSTGLAANRSSFVFCGTNNNGPNTSSTGSGSSHTHSYQSLAVKYVDVIIASKD